VSDVLAYDRRVPENLLAVLGAGGWAHSLVEYGRAGQYALDLQLRGYADKQGHWATLYVGLTKVADLHYHPTKGFRLNADKAYRKPRAGWRTSWGRFQTAERLAAQWSEVDAYLERSIPRIGSQYLREGAVQSAISGFASDAISVFDREATIAFSNQKEKSDTLKRLAVPVLAAAKTEDGPAWERARPRALGGECDALAVAQSGEVLAIEVKPATATSGITWSPLQARQYANLFAEWSRRNESAPDVISGMLEQRRRLGLLATDVPRVERPLRITPVVAIGHGCSKAALSRLREVQDRIIAAGLDDPLVASQVRQCHWTA
jgi:hypothetical protein